MGEIYDFTEYKSTQEIEMYESTLEEDEIMCFGCNHCGHHEFMMTVECEIICVDCGETWNKEEEAQE